MSKREARRPQFAEAITALWLGARLTRGVGLAGLFRVAMLAVATTIGCFLVMAALAVPVVVDAQYQRSVGRAVMHDDDGQTPIIVNDRSTLRLQEVRDSAGERPLTRIAVSGAGESGALPPGLPRFPAAGEIVASPELLRMLAADESMAKRFPQRVVGTIGPAGLVAPDELFAYIGVRDGLIEANQVAGFGDAMAIHSDAWAGASVIERVLKPERVLGYLFGLFLLAPLAVLIGVCARLSARVREQKLAAVRLLGVTQSQVQIANAVEVGTVTMLGALAGYLAFAVIGPQSTGWSVGRFRWYAEDLDVSPARAAVVVVCFTVFAMLVAASGTIPAMQKPLDVRRFGLRKTPSMWRALPLLVAVAALAYAATMGGVSSTTILAVGGGVLAMAVGVPVALPIVTHLLAALLELWQRGPIWIQLVAKRWRHNPGAAPRLVAGVVTTIFIAGIGLLAAGFAVQLQQPDLSPDGQPVTLVVSGHGLSPAEIEMLNGPGVTVTPLGMSMVTSGSASGLVVSARCEDLPALLGEVTGACVNGRFYRVVNTHPEWGDVTPRVQQWTLQDGTHLADPVDELHIRSDRSLANVLLIDTASGGEARDQLQVTFERKAYRDLAVRATLAAPAHQIVYPLGTTGGFDSAALLTVIACGAAIALAIGLLAFSIAAVDHQLAARRRNAGLTVLGVPRWLLQLVETAGLIATLVVGTAISALGLVLTTWALRRVSSLPVAVWDYAGVDVTAIVAGGLAILIAVTVIASRASTRLKSDLIRHE
ncbi:hypothetical protein Rhe02_15690 [Rhizocola hellebori]|uniref:FtsX-like permease family protein n=1 Tax=Rhizocola hellebori TaxID=1392758 RepID=A0A8J3Q548_9ACTN|nr:hypothetical protein [Rhizocola hellebori]GIH03502.1 hypothetical protein Rhe02_15690 [Rhizocola hellebori]